MGRATIVSLFPFNIEEKKPGVYPGVFILDPCLDIKKPSILQIGDSICHFFDGMTGKSIPMNQPVETMARSIVEDFRTGFISISPEMGPGIFWVEGHHSVEEIIKKFSAELKEATDRQYKWFEALVKMGDDDFAKYGQHRAISDLQRHAAGFLKLDRPWAKKIEEQRMISCPACVQTIPELALVCSHCQTIVNSQEYEKRGFKQAKGAA